MMSTLVPGGGSKATGRNAELSLHIFKRQTGSPEVELYTIGVWEGTHQRAICHDACLDCALGAIRRELANAGRAGAVFATGNCVGRATQP